MTHAAPLGIVHLPVALTLAAKVLSAWPVTHVALNSENIFHLFYFRYLKSIINDFKVPIDSSYIWFNVTTWKQLWTPLLHCTRVLDRQGHCVSLVLCLLCYSHRLSWLWRGPCRQRRGRAERIPTVHLDSVPFLRAASLCPSPNVEKTDVSFLFHIRRGS